MQQASSLNRSQPSLFLAIGHVTRDLHPDGTFSPGGTVTFASLCAHALGLSAAILTSADAEFTAMLSRELPGIDTRVIPADQTTTFANSYQQGFRTQYLHARAEMLRLDMLPTAWQDAPIVLFGPLAQELEPAFVIDFPRRSGQILAATPQGWLRRWDKDGRVHPTPWQAAQEVLPKLDVLILSHDDLLPFANQRRETALEILKYWSTLVPLLIATDGRQGADLFREGRIEHFPAYPAQEHDPTGAGDVFAAAFLSHLHVASNPAWAVDFANCVASFCIEQPGTRGIPTWEMIEKRLQQ